MELIADAVDGQDGIRQYRAQRPDVTLMDMRLPDMSGIEAMSAIRAEFTAANIIMLSTFKGEAEVRRALQLGARGYLLKSMPSSEIVAAIRRVHSGKKCVPADLAAELAEYLTEDTLTAREIEILQHVASGQRNREISVALSISEDTVKAHVKHIMEKLGASDRTAAVVTGIRRGIIRL